MRTFPFTCVACLLVASPGIAQGVDLIDSAGVSIITSRAPNWRGNSPWSVARQPSLVIGSTMGGPEELYVVTDALRLPDGTIVVANDGSKEIRAFDSRGQHLWSAGREGKGPSDFGRILGLAFRNDTIYAWDNRNGRLARLSRDGEVLNPVTFDPLPDAPISFHDLVGFVNDTSVLLFKAWFGVPGAGPEAIVWDSAANPLYHVTGRFLGGLGFTGLEQLRTPSSGTSALLWPRRTSHALRGGSLYTGDGSSWELQVFGAGAQLKKVIRLERSLPRALEEKRRAWIKRQVDAIPDNLPGPQRHQLVAHLERARLPEREPAFSAITIDELGYIWLQEYRHLKEYALPGPRTWTVLDPDGRWLGEMVLPDMEVQRIGTDWILGWKLGEYGIEQIVLYPLKRGA